MERGLEFLDEFLQLFRIDVADGKESYRRILVTERVRRQRLELAI
jgi:hypothetical protein